MIRAASAAALVLALALGAPILRAQAEETRALIRPGLGADVFTRTIAWDEDARESKLKTVLAVVYGEQ